MLPKLTHLENNKWARFKDSVSVLLIMVLYVKSGQCKRRYGRGERFKDMRALSFNILFK